MSAHDTQTTAADRAEVPLRNRLVAIIIMPLFFLVTFTICYVSAAHAPVPHDLALTVAGPASVTEQIALEIDDQAPGAFDITRTTDAAAAREAVENRSAVGAVIVAGADVTTVVASGAGALTVPVVEQVGSQVAAGLGGVATTADVSPLPAGDPGGSVLFFFLVICTVGSFLSITAISQAFPKARTRSLVATSAGAGILVPVLGFSMISIFVDFGVSFGDIAAAIGVGMIYAFTVGLLATFFARVVGPAAVLAQIIFLVALNFPAAGGSVPESMLPPFWQVIHNSWLGPGAFEAMRSILFFGGVDAGRWLLQLVLWTAGAAVLTLVAAIAMKRRKSVSEEPDEAGLGELEATKLGEKSSLT